MRRHYVLRCPGCGAPAADCVRICPYCQRATGFDGLGLGVTRKADGGFRISDGARVELGFDPDGDRPCPFCGAPNPAQQSVCGHCNAKIVIERMRVSSLEIVGGQLTVGSGGSLEVVGRRTHAIHRAAQAGDLAKVKACVNEGDDPDQQDGSGRRALHFAAEAGAMEVVRWLLSAGSDPDQPDDRGTRPRDVAATEEIADLLAGMGG